jgi:hypothetical protein
MLSCVALICDGRPAMEAGTPCFGLAATGAGTPGEVPGNPGSGKVVRRTGVNIGQAARRGGVVCRTASSTAPGTLAR